MNNVVINGKKLTAKEVVFCREYLRIRNGRQAAILAGYSENSATEQAYQVLRKEHIIQYIDQLETALREKAEITPETLIRDATMIKEEAMAGIPIYDDDGDLTDIVGKDPKVALSAIDQIAKILGLHKGPKGEGAKTVQINNTLIDLSQIPTEKLVVLKEILDQQRQLEESVVSVKDPKGN